ncbi:MAG: primosomal protein N' [Candidatus Gracilibacteria bacterium]|jgi:primosomal protein N' (replication factor Y)
MNFAEILFPQKIGNDRATLTYQIPDSINARIGQVVEIQLRNKKMKGVILNMHSQTPEYKTKEILGIVENAPHLEPSQIELLQWIAHYYFCPTYKALKLFLPIPFIKKKKIIAPDFTQQDELQTLKSHALNADQLQVLQTIEQSQKKVALLHGITGSGKTEIYLHIADKQVHEGKQVLMLIPEISLTAQTVQRFKQHFHHKVAVIHSQLTAKEKEKAWQSIHKEEAKIVIGSRSALFAPFKNLGFIILDEEHDSSYKQDQSPHYNTLDVAIKMAEILNIKVLAGSATPSLETYYQAKQGNYELVELNERATKEFGSTLPKTTIVDLREEIKKKNFSIFSEALQAKLTDKLQTHEQAILFLNRRGAASAVLCRTCGYIVKCDKCDTSMTYHQRISIEGGIYQVDRLICHHCGKIGQVPKICPKCESAYIRYLGLGTQRVEDEMNKLFPVAKVIRADSDTTTQRDSFKNIYTAFKNHEADILVGTQMISLGLHLPKVNLVGIILADLSLTIPNFRSAEKTFQLLTQVSGRAGRESNNGEVVIQTYLPNNYVIKKAAAHDYLGFYDLEIALRNELKYPPFTKLIKLTIAETDIKKAKNKAEEIYQKLLALNSHDPSSDTPASVEKSSDISIYPALIPRFRNKYRWHILINGENPRELLKKYLQQKTTAQSTPTFAPKTIKSSPFAKKFTAENPLKIDVDPLSTV